MKRPAAVNFQEKAVFTPKYGIYPLLTAYLYHATIISVIFINIIHVNQLLEENIS